MRLTKAGIGLTIVGVACFVIGRLFGTLEMFLLGAMCLSALLFAVLYTSTAGLDLAVSRTASPLRLRAGAPARIDLGLRNEGKRSTPVLEVSDQVQGTSAAVLMLAPIKGQSDAQIAYRLPTRRRGRLVVGPLDLTLGDPLGLTRSRVRASQDVTLTVHAELIELPTLHATAGHDPTAEQQRKRALASGGDEFFALRPYVVGDELRRVDWRATARTDDLVVRQEERPRTGRVTVLLDRRSDVYDEEGFERAVSAALSVLFAAWKSDDSLRFVTSGTSTFADIRSRAELDAIDEQLATINRSDRASLLTAIDELSRVGHGGTLVIVTGTTTSDLAAGIERSRRSFGTVHAVLCMPTEHPPAGAIPHDGTVDFAEHWAKATIDTTKLRTGG